MRTHLVGISSHPNILWGIEPHPPPRHSASKEQDLAPNLSLCDSNHHPLSTIQQYHVGAFRGRGDGEKEGAGLKWGQGRRLRWWVDKCLMSTCYPSDLLPDICWEDPKEISPSCHPTQGKGPEFTYLPCRDLGHTRDTPVPHPHLLQPSLSWPFCAPPVICKMEVVRCLLH